MKLTTMTQVTIDGVMQGNGGASDDRRNGFERGGWARGKGDNETKTFINQTYQRADAFLLGRRTYELFAGSWGTLTIEDVPGWEPVWQALDDRRMKDEDRERLENLVGAFVLAVSDRIHAATEAAVGHSGAGAAALVLVGQFPGMSVEQLSHPLGLSHSATVRAVDRLVAQGFVKREPSGSGPAVSLHPTEAGRRKAREIVEVRQQAIRAALEGVSAAEAERLTGVLEKGLATLSDRPETTACRLCDAERCRREDCPVVHKQNELGNHPPDPVPLPPPKKGRKR